MVKIYTTKEEIRHMNVFAPNVGTDLSTNQIVHHSKVRTSFQYSESRWF